MMKKVFIPFFSCLLVFTLLLGSFSSAKAEVGDDPVVTPVSGDMEFTTEVFPIASLPGTIELADLMLAPVGFPEGEAQFEGAGVLVTKFDAGKASACFTISGTQWGWGGKVGMWNGTKWMLLPTTITTPEESSTSSACATITGSGTYAIIKYVVDPSLLPKSFPACSPKTFTIPMVMPRMKIFGRWLPGYLSLGMGGNILISDQQYPVGSPVTFELLESTPTGIFTMPIKVTGTVSYVYGPTVYDSIAGLYIHTVTYTSMYFSYTGSTYPSLEYKVTLPNCYYDGVYPPQMSTPN